MTTTTIEPTQRFFCTAAEAGRKHELEYDEDTILGGDGKRVRMSGRFRPRNLPIPTGIGPRAMPSQVRFELVSQAIGKRARYVDEVGTDALKVRILRDRRMWFVEDIAEKHIVVAPAVVHRHMSVDETPATLDDIAETLVTVKEEPESDGEVPALSSTSTPEPWMRRFTPPLSIKKSKTSFGSLRSFSTAVAKAKSSLSKLKARMERKAISKRSTASSSRSRSPDPKYDFPESVVDLNYGTETEVDEEEQVQEEMKVQEKKLRRSKRLREKRRKEAEEAAAAAAAAEEEAAEEEGEEQAENESDAEAAEGKKNVETLDDDSTTVEAPEKSSDDTATTPKINATKESEDNEEVSEEASKVDTKEEDTDSTPELKSSPADSDLDLTDLTPTSTVSSTSSSAPKLKKKKRRSRAEKEARLRRKKKKSSKKALGFEDIEMVDDTPTGDEEVEETSMEPTDEATEAKPDVDDAPGVKDVELPASSADSEEDLTLTTSKPAFPIPTDILTPPPTPPRRAPATPTPTIDIAAVIEKLTPPTTSRTPKPSTRSRLSAILQKSILRFDPGNISRHAYRDPFPPIREDEEEEEGVEVEVVLVQVGGCGGKGEGMGVEGVLEGLERFSMTC